MGNDSPLVCICIPTYNAARTVRETLESILAQTYPNLLVHVSDNASTDDTVKVVESIRDPRITVHRNAENIGGEGNFNRCIQLGTGKYTAIFHADDLYEPDMVEKQVAFLEANADAGAVFTAANVIDDGGCLTGRVDPPQSFTTVDRLYDFKTLFRAVLQYSNFLICPSVMARTEVYQREIQRWHGEEFGNSADLDVWFRISLQHAIGILPERLIRYRISVNQFSERLRSRTGRSDFFRVMDHYLAREDVQSMLTADDWNNYRRLKRTDRVVRAVNLYLQGGESEARELCREVPSMDAFRAAFASRRGAMTLLAGIALRLFISMRLSAIGKPLLRWMKRLVGK